jgi:hypothetical protein
MGHQDQFPPPNLNGRSWSGEPTFTGMGSKEDDAPSTVIRGAEIVRLSSTLNRPSCPCRRIRWVYRGAVIRTTRLSNSRQLVEQRLCIF